MMQGRCQLGRMLDTAGTNSRPDIVDKHLADALGPVLLMQQILPQDCCGHFRHMLMLGNGGDFRFRQSAKANAVFKGNHP